MTTTARPGSSIEIDGFELRTDRCHDPESGMWILRRGPNIVRIGINALTADTYGQLAQLILERPGTFVPRGEAFGSLEAAKFVGPLLAPVAGTIRAVNPAVEEDPGLVLRSPYDGGWLIEVETDDLDPELLIDAADQVAWFARLIEEHRRNGLVAE